MANKTAKVVKQLLVGIACVGFMLCLAPVQAQSPDMDMNQPMHIESDKVVYSQNQRELEFTGNVHVIRPDFELWCEKLTAYLASASQTEAKTSDREGIGGAGDVRRIVARDQVRLRMDQREATSNQAEYDARKERLVLQGDVVLREAKNKVQGHKVTFYLDEGRSQIESSPENRVKAVFFPEQEGKDE